MLREDLEDDELGAVYGRWQRTGGMELRLTRNFYKGDDIVDLRLWLSSGKPTRKGVTVALADVDAVIGSLRAAQAA